MNSYIYVNSCLDNVYENGHSYRNFQVYISQKQKLKIQKEYKSILRIRLTKAKHFGRPYIT